MKTERSYIRFIALTIISFMTFNAIVFSQGTDSGRKYAKEGKLYTGIVITPQITSINNNGFSAAKTLNQKGGTSLDINLEGGYFFSKMIGISIGGGMGSYSTNLTIDSCSFSFLSTDSENESYEMRINGKSITEEQKISFLRIPVCVVLKIPAGAKLGFYAKAGLSFNIPIVKSYSGSGIFTYNGYYAAYPVLLHDLPAYGFPSDLNTKASGDLEIISFSQTLVASGGVSYSLNDAIQLILGLQFNRSLGSISDYSTDSDYSLTSKANELNSIMGGTSGAGVQGFGVSLGLRYYIR
ncbi:MAG: hypothetical protein MUC93_03320 [Bacteroidales bacterium]|jgi:hypothetical protein|nr:hypothetical protein [Bacteroidales bacterium]